MATSLDSGKTRKSSGANASKVPEHKDLTEAQMFPLVRLAASKEHRRGNKPIQSEQKGTKMHKRLPNCDIKHLSDRMSRMRSFLRMHERSVQICARRIIMDITNWCAICGNCEVLTQLVPKDLAH
jgi:hypothetical protein